MIHFKLAKHTRNEGDVVEIWSDEEFIGAVYPWKDTGVRIMSKHIQNRVDMVYVEPQEPPAIVINLLT